MTLRFRRRLVIKPPLILKTILGKFTRNVNQFLSKPRRISSEGYVLVVLGVILSGILVDIQIDKATHVEVQNVTQTTQPKREVKIEVTYESWTPEVIERKVLEAFPDAPIMLKVMKCEGGYKIDAYNPTNGSGDKGLFQVSTLHHGKRVKALGLDMNNPVDNIKYARMLYDEQGLNPWVWSKHCWSKEDKPLEAFYKSRKNNLFGNCIECMKARQKEAYCIVTTLEPAKTYVDYLKEQKLYEYYKRTLKYQV